jgi:23S rRNA (uracil1939-C5)-methyltransferase
MAVALDPWLVQQDSITLEYDRGRIDGGAGTAMFRVDSESFVQVNHEQAHNLYGVALRYLGDRPGAVVEGYAGFGAMSALAGSRPDEAARPTRVTLVEENRAAATLARLHMRLHGVEGASVLAGRLEERLALLEPDEVDSVLIDPPRAGCAPEVVRELARLQPGRIVYVSCDPATLGRDLKALAAEGYVVAAQTMVDMFPQTYHVETVSLLQKG